MTADPDAGKAARHSALARLESWLDLPMLVLGLVWLGLVVAELISGLSPLLTRLSTAIWIIFLVDFGVRLILAPDKWQFIRRDWLGVVSLALPALRVVRVLRLARLVRAAPAARGIRLVRVVGSANRGMRALARAMGRRGLAYVVAVTAVVVVAGAGGMYAFERDVAGAEGLESYGAALWWTAMLMTTMGSAYWPQTAEGRVLCLLLAVYAFTVFGYVTAALASYFVGRDAGREESDVAGEASVTALRAEIRLLAAEVRAGREPQRDPRSGAP